MAESEEAHTIVQGFFLLTCRTGGPWRPVSDRRLLPQRTRPPTYQSYPSYPSYPPSSSNSYPLRSTLPATQTTCPPPRSLPNIPTTIAYAGMNPYQNPERSDPPPNSGLMPNGANVFRNFDERSFENNRPVPLWKGTDAAKGSSEKFDSRKVLHCSL